MEKSILFYLLHSSITSNAMQIYKDLIKCYTRKILRFSSIALPKFIAQINNNSEKEENEELTSDHEKREVLELMGINYNDVNLVMASLGLEGWRREVIISGNNMELELPEAVFELLEDKNMTLRELKEAFYVFDRDEDGFISAFELWSVLRRLGFKEGIKYEDCEKMIRSFDQDSDDRINFQEFKNMMENST